MDILVGSAWPYANGSLNVGQAAAVLPADVIARYHRAAGDTVYFVSGSDCHGAPVANRAKQKKIRPQEVSDCYHAQFKECFRKLGFSFDCYSKTTNIEHKEFVRDFHRKLYKSPYVYEKNVPRRAGKKEIQTELTNHLYIGLSQLKDILGEYANAHPEWSERIGDASRKYLVSGIKDMVLTTDLQWGIDVPRVGFEDKKIYVWAENVLGYLTAGRIAAERNGEDFRKLFGKNAKHYYVFGRDNIPFHTMLLPAMLIAEGEDYHLPDEVYSGEYLTYRKKRISHCRDERLLVKNMTKEYPADAIRYYLLSLGLEEKEAEYSEKELVEKNNSQLYGSYGNFVSGVVSCLEKSYERVIPDGKADEKLQNYLENLYEKTEQRIEAGRFKEALDDIFSFIHKCNQAFEQKKPTLLSDGKSKESKNILYNSVQTVVNLAVLLEPFLPFSSQQVLKAFDVPAEWKRQEVSAGSEMAVLRDLFVLLRTQE